MAKSRKRPEPEPKRFSFSAWLARTFTMVIVGILIIVVTAVLFAKTDGFRSLVEREVEKDLGLAMVVADSGFDWNGDLRLHGLHSAEESGSGEAGIRIEEARVRLSLPAMLRGGPAAGLCRLDLIRCEITFAPGADGRMRPERMDRVTEWLARWGQLALPTEDTDRKRNSLFLPVDRDPPTDGGGLAAFDWGGTRVTVRDAEIRWLDASGRVLVSIHDVDFTAIPIRLPTRDATYLHLAVSSIELADSARVHDMDVELLRTGGSYLVLNLEAVRQTGEVAEGPWTEQRAAATDVMPEQRTRQESVESPASEAAASPPPHAAAADRASHIRAELERAVAD